MWLQTVRVARDFGGIEQLLPDGISSWRDCPHRLFEAVQMALTFLSFRELPKEEQPPRAIWFSQRQLEEHFKAVEKMREEKYGGKDGDGPGPIDDPVQNELTKRR